MNPATTLSHLTEPREPSGHALLVQHLAFGEHSIDVRLALPGEDERYILAWITDRDPLTIDEAEPALVGLGESLLDCLLRSDCQAFTCLYDGEVILQLEVNVLEDVTGAFSREFPAYSVRLSCARRPPIELCAQALIAATTYFLSFPELKRIYTWVFDAEVELIAILEHAGYERLYASLFEDHNKVIYQSTIVDITSGPANGQ